MWLAFRSANQALDSSPLPPKAQRVASKLVDEAGVVDQDGDLGPFRAAQPGEHAGEGGRALAVRGYDP